MGFRDMFKKMAGERPLDTTQERIPAPIAPTVNYTPPKINPVSEMVRPEPDVTVRPVRPVSTTTNPMERAKMLLAAKRRVRLVVRGISKHGITGYSGVFVPGAEVSFERDPHNSHDPNAVKVLLSDGSMLGYIAREMAGNLSKQLEEGWRFRVQIAEGPYVEDKWGQCELEVMDKCPPERGVQHGVS